jgi:hypothetical protein
LVEQICKIVRGHRARNIRDNNISLENRRPHGVATYSNPRVKLCCNATYLNNIMANKGKQNMALWMARTRCPVQRSAEA